MLEMRIDGEAETDLLDEAIHWRGVYRELLATCREVRSRVHGSGGASLSHRIEALEDRLTYWSRRCRELAEPAPAVEAAGAA